MRMKKTIIFMLLILVSSAYGVAEEFDFGGIRLRFFSDDINIPGCIHNIMHVNISFLDGLEAIEISERFRYYYSYGKVIYMDEECDLDLFIHEVAHHRQLMDGNYHEIGNHGRSFRIWERILIEDTYYDQIYFTDDYRKKQAETPPYINAAVAPGVDDERY